MTDVARPIYNAYLFGISTGITTETSTRKNAPVLHEQIWKQCLGEIDNAVPEKIREPMEQGFEIPCKVPRKKPRKDPKKKSYEVDIKMKLMQSINASLGRVQMIKP
jgi:hypothetical protein